MSPVTSPRNYADDRSSTAPHLPLGKSSDDAGYSHDATATGVLCDDPAITPGSAPPRRRRKATFSGRFTHLPTPSQPRSYRWGRVDTISTLIIAALALLTRFLGITTATASNTPVFDEKHYVPQAWDIVESWINPVTGGIESNPGYGLVVHPPLAKQLIAIGEWLFGYSPLGWRLVPALCGTAVVLLAMAIARRLSGSPFVAFCAGLLAVVDGVLVVTSRFGMLDIIQVLFIVAAAWALIRDHQQMEDRMYQAWSAGLLTEPGIRAGFRWWRFTAGVFLGCALSVKWSGLYYMAFFGVMMVVLDALRRRRYGIRRPWSEATLFDALHSFLSLVVVPIALYVWSWRAWFASETSVYRHAATDGTIETSSWLHHLPEAIAGWLYYHQSVLAFHSSLTTSNGHSHPWDSKPWSWLAATRPILYYSSTNIPCEEDTCRRMIYLFGTPAIWWLTVPILCWALWRMVIHKDLRFLIPFVAFQAGFLPWVASYDRQMYFFYATALVPFTIVIISLILGTLYGRGAVLQWRKLQRIGIPHLTVESLTVILYLALAVAMFGYFSPIIYGIRITDNYFNQLMWLNSWQ
ncbi:dolichyl-phosphate-mannose--protein mannosyltransferase [Corynebacterium pseudotuberculosis]|uniref:dolichyl-phosphate-mannose--protein mannosyltransferase n=1 Tax=Corynebacterium pseudotuberculosis TaxID=1719 RepID=UPI0007192130|nr:phospholipid carrier-dependent glycosyltransferase [Corynebacterium pseudotuberculosis]